MDLGTWSTVPSIPRGTRLLRIIWFRGNHPSDKEQDHTDNDVEQEDDDFCSADEATAECQAIEFYHVDISDPSTYEEALQSPDSAAWCESMQEEIQTLEERKVFQRTKPIKPQKVLGTRWVYVRKRSADGKVKSHRSRLVAQGFRQRMGIDFQETYSPVVDFALVRLFLLLLVVVRGWTTLHLDVKCAYLYADLKEETYIKPPLIANEPPGVLWKLHKALYGLHQAGHCWYNELDRTLKDLGFCQLVSTRCVYRYGWKVIILVYVDDFLLIGRTLEDLDRVCRLLRKRYDIKDLGPVCKFLGIEIAVTKDRTVVLHQRSYIDRISSMFLDIRNMQVFEPMKVGTDVAVFHQENQEPLGQECKYRSLIGCLLYLARHTRPDISFAISFLARFVEAPGLTEIPCLFRRILGNRLPHQKVNHRLHCVDWRFTNSLEIIPSDISYSFDDGS
jgi:hypothetical protein